jgi:2'-5' RNA ligase
MAGERAFRERSDEAPERMRIFLALMPDGGTGDRFARMSRLDPGLRQGQWMRSEDLHMTLLFGGWQPKARWSAWKDGVDTAAENLAPVAMDHAERSCRVSWNAERKLLALEFLPDVPFWREADRVGRILSERLLGQSPMRGLWPHLTLARKISLAQGAVLGIEAAAAGILRLSPLKWTSVCLLESDPSNTSRTPRYRILYERTLGIEPQTGEGGIPSA